MSISESLYKQTKKVLADAGNVLLIINNRASLDAHLAMAATYLHLQSQGKNVTVCANGELILRHKRLLEEIEVKCEMELPAQSYVIAIDHAEGEIEKVSYDDKDGKFKLYITPSPEAKKFDFDKVSYSQGGGDFDVICVFGVRSLKWLDSLYGENRDLFKKATVININNLTGTQEYGTIKLVDSESSVSKIVYGIVEGESSPSIETISSLLLMGLLDHLQLLQGSDYKISTVEKMVGLVRAGADLKGSMNKLYFDRTVENFEVLRRVMNSLKIDSEAGVIWSSVSAFDMSQCGVARDEFVLDGRIIFNVCRDFKIAFVMYEVEENEIVVEFESNESELNTRDLLSGFKVSGNSARVFFTVRNRTLADLEQEILEMIAPKLGGTRTTIDEGEKERPLIGDKVDEREGKVLRPEVEEIVPEIDEVPEKVEDKAILSTQVSQEPLDSVENDDDGLVTPPPISPDNT